MMNRNRVRLVVGPAIILTHICALWGVIVWQSEYIPSSAERLDLAMLLIPVSAGYVVAVVRSAIETKSAANDNTSVNPNYMAVVFLVTLAFCAALLFSVFKYPSIVGPTIVEFRRWLVVLEIGFGTGFGLIAEDLFGRVEKIVVRREEGDADLP